MDNLIEAANRFAGIEKVADIRRFGNGNVHGTFLVSLEENKRFILQRMNTRVFKEPGLVMKNIKIVTEHVKKRMELENPAAGTRWELPCVIAGCEGRDHWIDSEGSFWRALSFIEDSRSFDTIQDSGHAREVGRALGLFQALISDLPASRLADTLPGFHVTPLYVRRFDEVVAERGAGGSCEREFCLKFINERRKSASGLEDAAARGRLFLRPIHGDPKVNNVMVDEATGEAVSMVDLDTVKPGLVHYDIGDCLRSGCNPLGEETRNWEAVRFEPDLCRDILQGYLMIAKDFLTEGDFDYIYESIRLIVFELGLRFFTDYLEGNVYFKASREEHNLFRALVQFRLAESIESQRATIEAIVEDVR